MLFQRRAFQATAAAVIVAAGLATGGGLARAQAVGGNDASVSVSLPVTVCGNGVGVLGVAGGACSSASASAPAAAVASSGGSSRGVASGNAASVAATAPVTVCGNAVGRSSASCTSRSSGSSAAAASSGSSTGSGGIVAGNAVPVAVAAPVTVCGNGVGVLGVAAASCTTDQTAASSGASTDAMIADWSLLGTNTAPVAVAAPVTVCGNGAGVAGAASATCTAPSAPSSSDVTPASGLTPPADRSLVAIPTAAQPSADAVATTGRATSSAGSVVDRLPLTGAVTLLALVALGTVLVASGGLSMLAGRVRALR